MNICSRVARMLRVLSILACFHLLVARAADPVPTVTTDLADYAPFTYVQITGAGFQPGEIVNNQVVQIEGPAPGSVYAPWSVTADAQGGFQTTWYVFTDDLIGTTLQLTATGQASGLTATATFNDSATTCPPPPTGTPLTGMPVGGFAMDGDLQASASSGDWVPGTGSGPGSAVMTAAGVPVNPITTFHLTDGFGAAENNFNGGLKVDNNPNLWTWVINPTTGKDDINNALIHISTASDGHRWLVVSADRAKNNGDSYVDFEFLQNSLSITTNSDGITGGFTSAGPHGGRTTNDFLLTISFTRGGTTPGVCLERWLATGTGYDYVDSPLPTGFVFGAVNTSVIPVPYGAFGSSTYDINTFAEVAVDVTQLMAGFDRCLSVGVKSIMVKSKTSQSPQATIVDFIAPLGIDLKLGPTADAGPDQAKCSEGASTTFTLNGAAYAGLDPIISTNWSVVSGSATIDSTNSLATSVHVSSTSATLRLTLTTAVETGCAKMDDVILTVNQPPSCSITGAAPVCPSSTNTYNGPDAMDSYSWSISGNGTIVGSTSSQSVSVKAGSGCNEDFALTLTTTKYGCSKNCSQNFLVQDTTKPTVTKGSISSCYPNKASAEAAAIAATTASDNCPGDLTMTASTAGNCSAVITVRGTDACGNYAEVSYNTRIDNAGPVFSGLPDATLNLQCLADVPTATVTANDDCDGPRSVSFQETPSGTDCNKSIVRTWTASDTCGHTTTFTQTIIVKDETNPTVTKGSIAACYADLASAEAAAKAATSVSDNCSAVTKSASTVGTCSAVITVRGTDACGNYAEVSYNTRIDNAGPVLSGLPDATLNVQCLTDVPTAATVTANDDCDGSRTVNLQESSSGTDCNKSVVRTWTASDTCGHTTTFTQTITVKDETNPTVTKGSIAACYADLVSAEAAAKAATSVSDNCSAVTKSASTTGTCNAVVTVRGTDVCGNYAEVTYNTRIDNTGPVFNGLPDATLNVRCLTDVPEAATVTANDDCDGSRPVSFQETSSGTDCNKSIVRTWTATDTCGHTTTFTQTITVKNETNPTVTKGSIAACYADLASAEAAAKAATSVSDNCSAVTKSASTVGTCSAVITVRGTDGCGNYSEVTYNTRIDNAGPVFNGLPDATLNVQCLADVPTAATVTANDDCDGSRTVSFQETPSGTDCNKSIVRTWTASDTCGHTTTFSQTITVKDETNPTVTKGSIAACYADLASAEAAAKAATSVSDNCSAVTKSASTVGACDAVITVRGTDACGNYAEVSYNTRIDNAGPVFNGLPDATLNVQCLADVPTAATVTANDDCDGSRTVSFQETPSGTDCNKSIVRTWTASDTCGHTTTFSQTITVKDETNPTVTKGSIAACYADLASAEAAAKAATSVSDNCSAVTKSASTVGTCDAVITVRGTDACGNYAEVSYNTRIDNAGPVFSGLPDATLNVQCLADVPTATVTANDDCDGSRPVSFQETPNGTDCNKSIVRTWTASDTCGHTTTFTQTITVKDETNPTVTKGSIEACYADLASAEAAAKAATSVSDNCSAVTKSASTVGTCSAVITVRGTDACGNYAEVSYNTRIDNAGPVLSGLPDATLNVQCLTDVPTAATVTASDDCDGSRPVSLQETSSGTDCNKSVVRTWTASDTCGHTTTFTQTITVTDTTPPVITCPINTTVTGTGSTSTNATGVATATDNCDSNPLITYADSETPGDCANTRVITRTWTATDSCGNAVSCAQKITVSNTTPPTIHCPATATVECNTSTDPSVTGRATATSSTGAVLTASYSDSSVTGNCPNTKVITRTWSATDACGLTTSCRQTINVVDTTAPRVTCPADTTVDCNASTEPSATGSATATDNCDPQPRISHSDAVTGVCPKIITRTWTATDCAGHNSSCAQKITIVDTTPPVIRCPTNITVEEYTSTDPSVTGRATAVDNCDPAPTITYSDVASTVEPIVITRTWTATDCTGNRSVCTQTITLEEEPNGGGTLITDTMRCTLPNNQLRLIFSPDTKNISCNKLTASNPGQFYFNVLYPAAPGTSRTFHITLPYPWVTQGARPIEVYDGVTMNTSGGQTCLVPGNKILAGSQQVTLSNYAKPVMGVTTYSFDVTVTVPPSGFVFLAIHLDYGLKGSTGYGQNSAADATVCGSTGILIPNGQPYTFSVSGGANDSSTVSSYNTFKKNPGTGGLAQSQTSTFSVPNAAATLKDAKGTVLGTGVTDQDGWYMINYKATGKATTYYLTLTPPKGSGSAQTKSIALKANGYVEVDFTTP